MLHTGQQLPALKETLGLLLPIAGEWMNIGVMLAVPYDILKRISSEQCSDSNCLREVLHEWLTQISPVPTWTRLAEAVTCFDKKKADQIHNHVKLVTDNTSLLNEKSGMYAGKQHTNKL